MYCNLKIKLILVAGFVQYIFFFLNLSFYSNAIRIAVYEKHAATLLFRRLVRQSRVALPIGACFQEHPSTGCFGNPFTGGGI